MRDSANIPESRRPAMTASGRSESLADDRVRPEADCRSAR